MKDVLNDPTLYELLKNYYRAKKGQSVAVGDDPNWNKHNFPGFSPEREDPQRPTLPKYKEYWPNPDQDRLRQDLQQTHIPDYKEYWPNPDNFRRTPAMVPNNHLHGGFSHRTGPLEPTTTSDLVATSQNYPSRYSTVNHMNGNQIQQSKVVPRFRNEMNPALRLIRSHYINQLDKNSLRSENPGEYYRQRRDDETPENDLVLVNTGITGTGEYYDERKPTDDHRDSRRYYDMPYY